MSANQQLLKQGWQLHQAGDIATAENLYRRVLATSPRDSIALVYLGIALFDRRKFEQSVAAYREAIEIRPQYPIAWNNLGNSLRMLGRIEEAEESFAHALRQQPNYMSAIKNRGTLWLWAGEIERGLKWYERGLQVDPEHAELHRNLGVINLLLGNYDVGWSEYRWRWKMPGMHRPPVSAPVWKGESIDGKTVLLYPEQGNGDAIHFVRAAKALNDRGASVVLRCPARLVNLFSSAPAVDRMVIESVSPPQVDFHVSMIEAIDVIFQQTGQIAWGTELFHDHRGYLTVANELTAYWQRWLDQHSPNRRIGINWQGNPDHHADVYRSVALSSLQPLSRIPGVDLIGMQFGFGCEQIEACEFGDAILRLPDHVDTEGGAFTDSAAILQNLDCLVTTDTAIAHLAGAVGTEVYLMLGKVPDWRWLLDSETTAWYPTVKLIRQRDLGSWKDVVERIRCQLSVAS